MAGNNTIDRCLLRVLRVYRRSCTHTQARNKAARDAAPGLVAHPDHESIRAVRVLALAQEIFLQDTLGTHQVLPLEVRLLTRLGVGTRNKQIHTRMMNHHQQIIYTRQQ
jgi:hypothetical protein